MELKSENLEALRSKYARYTVSPGSAVKPLKSILFVGAHLAPRAETGIDMRDENRFEDALDLCQAHNIAVDPEFTVNCINIDPAAVEGHQPEDFLDGKYKADLVVSDFLNDPYPRREHSDPNNYGVFSISPRHYLDNVFYESALATGARAIVVWKQGRSAVGPEKFSGPEFSIAGAHPKCTLLLRNDFAKNLGEPS